MGTIMRWVGFIAAIFGIIAFVINLASAWPFNCLLVFWKHHLVKISSSDEFKVETIYTSSGKGINPPDKFSYKFHLPIEARGTTDFNSSDNIWVVLRDEHGGYYLQNPPVEIKKSEWRSYNIRPLHGIKRIIWLKMDSDGHSLFIRKLYNAEWGKFIDLPVNSVEVAYAELR